MRSWVLVVLAGCGRIGFPTEPGADGSTTDGAPACAFGPWSTPVRVPELSSTAGEYGGQITRDGLSYYYRSDRSGAGDLFFAHRASRASAFVVSPLAELDSAADEPDITFSVDELEVYFTSARMGGDCIYHATRAAIDQPFANLDRLDELCAGGPVAGPFLTDDGLTLYYNSEDNNPEGVIFMSRRTSRLVDFGPGAAVRELADFGDDVGYPALSSDGLTIYFEQGKSTPHQLFQASRTSVDAKFDAVEMPIANVGSPGNIDEDVSITGDGLELYFASSRPGGAGNDDIYRATRSCL